VFQIIGAKQTSMLCMDHKANAIYGFGLWTRENENYCPTGRFAKSATHFKAIFMFVPCINNIKHFIIQLMHSSI
jgi:hypothetical protein